MMAYASHLDGAIAMGLAGRSKTTISPVNTNYVFLNESIQVSFSRNAPGDFDENEICGLLCHRATGWGCLLVSSEKKAFREMESKHLNSLK